MKRSNRSILFNAKSARIFTLAICCLLTTLVNAQQEKKFIYDGNSQYKRKDFAGAAKQYEKAVSKNKDSYKGAFNLGDAYYNQGKYEDAANQFQLLTHRATSKDTLSKAYHNLGNSLLKSKKYQESVEAYKNALKNNPNDEDTRYNLSYAQQMLKKQQEQQKKQQNKDKDNKDKDNKDKKDKDKKDNKDKDKKDKKDKQNKDKQDKENKEKQEQNNISKDDAKRILDALQNDEKNIQDKVKKGKVNGVKVKIEKDW
jgi:tetratricopeptide (TPR) repeat protein